MKMITSALITLIAAAAFATDHNTAAAPATTAPAATTQDHTAPGSKMAKAPTKEECTKDKTLAGCEKWNKAKK